MTLIKTIKTVKKLIDMPYNQFNLENYFSILYDYKLNPITVDTKENQPIKLMSGNNFYSRIVTCDYHQAIHHKKRIFIIGKGMLFDSGGYNLKRDMGGMFGDKAGMITAIAVANHCKSNVIAYCPVTTNFIHNSRIIPGDVIKIGNKKVLVNNTDAEGRLVLAEAISTIPITKNDIIITIATLTGACGYAIDSKATGVLTPSDKLAKLFLDASEEVKEYAWRLPMFDYMQDFYKKQPIKNANDKIKAGTSEGAMFIKQFIPYPNQWLHLDIAYSAFDDKGKANGVPIKTLLKFIERIK